MINKAEIVIWGRAFTFPVRFDCYKGETVTKEQENLLASFLKEPTSKVETAKKNLIKYCQKDVQSDKDNDKKDNIFSYIKPDYLFVKRDTNNPSVALMCKYRYDPEHGLAVVFHNDGKIEVGIQDIIL